MGKTVASVALNFSSGCNLSVARHAAVFPAAYLITRKKINVMNFSLCVFAEIRVSY